MMKKLISLIGAGAILLSVATPAFGWSMTVNKAKIKSETSISANSGANGVGNGVSVYKAHVGGEVEVKGDNNVTTGKVKVENKKVIAANTEIGCDTCETSGMTVNKAKIKSETSISANSGANVVGNGVSVEKAGVDGSLTVGGDNDVTTGKVKVENKELILVNTQVSFP